jgi:hypothetical protein
VEIHDLAQTLAPPVPRPASPRIDHLSWSSLETYALCPAKYRFRYLEKAPAECIPSALAFGHAFHAAFEQAQQARLEGLGVPEEAALIQAFESGWAEETKDGPPVQYGKDESAESLRELATRMLEALRQGLLQESPGGTIIAIEHAERFRLLEDVPPIEMRLDLLEVRGEELLVTDLKTSRCAWNERKVREQLPQIVLYAHGLLPLAEDLNVKRIVPRLLVVTKSRKPQVQVLEPLASASDARRLKERVVEAWAAIQAGIFVKHDSWACGGCPYRTHCRHA